jgi:hypothetical protein
MNLVFHGEYPTNHGWKVTTGQKAFRQRILQPRFTLAGRVALFNLSLRYDANQISACRGSFIGNSCPSLLRSLEAA